MLIFDYHGYGKSQGIPTVDGVIANAVAARTKLAMLCDIPETAVVLMGRSFGGAIALQLAAAVPCGALIIESSFSSLRDAAELHFPQLASLVPRDKLNFRKSENTKGP